MGLQCAMFLPWLLGLVAGGALDCSNDNPCNMTATTELPIIVKEGMPWSIMYTADDFELCKDDANADVGVKCSGIADQIELRDGSGKDCTLYFNWVNGANMDKGNLTDCTDDTTRSSQWKARYDGNRVDEIGAYFERAHEEDSGEWTIKVKPNSVSTPVHKVTKTFQVWVVAAPETVIFTDEQGGPYDEDKTLTATNTGAETWEYISCGAGNSRPQAVFSWTVDGEHVYTIGSVNSTIANATTEEGDTDRDVNTNQTLGFRVDGWWDGKNLTCTADVHDNDGNSVLEPEDRKSVSVIFNVEAPPEPSPEEEMNPEGMFEAGEEGVLNIRFRSNPEPTELEWDLADMETNLTSSKSGNMTVSWGRYTSEGWKSAVAEVNTTIVRAVNNPNHAYVATLRVAELTAEDSEQVHTLTITNLKGSTTYRVRIATIEGGLSTGAIAGIVVGCIAAVLLVALAVLMFVRHKNGKKSKKIKQKKKEREPSTDRV